jgi:hypothetical protein
MVDIRQLANSLATTPILTAADLGISLIRLRSMPSFLVRQPEEGMA